MDRKKFTAAEERILIDFVRDNELLYNPRNEDFRDIEMKQMAWNTLGLKINKTGAECTKKWHNIKDYYVRRKRQSVLPSYAIKKRDERLSFLEKKPSVKKENSSNVETSNFKTDSIDSAESNENDNYSNIDNDSVKSFQYAEVEDQIEIEGDDYPSDTSPLATELTTKSCKKKRKRPIQSDTSPVNRPSLLPRQADSLDTFFSAMCDTVRTFPKHNIAEIKLKISQIIGEMEVEVCLNERRYE